MMQLTCCTVSYLCQTIIMCGVWGRDYITPTFITEMLSLAPQVQLLLITITVN